MSQYPSGPQPTLIPSFVIERLFPHAGRHLTCPQPAPTRAKRRLTFSSAKAAIDEGGLLPPEFTRDPLEFFDPPSQLARRYDAFVVSHLSQYTWRLAYHYLAADPKGAIGFSHKTRVRASHVA